MLTQEQRNRLHILVQLYVEELPLQAAVDALLLLYDVCEILELDNGQLEAIFGSATLRLVTGFAYGAAPRPTRAGVAALQMPLIETTPSNVSAAGTNGQGPGQG